MAAEPLLWSRSDTCSVSRIRSSCRLVDNDRTAASGHVQDARADRTLGWRRGMAAACTCSSVDSTRMRWETRRNADDIRRRHCRRGTRPRTCCLKTRKLIQLVITLLYCISAVIMWYVFFYTNHWYPRESLHHFFQLQYEDGSSNLDTLRIYG